MPSFSISQMNNKSLTRINMNMKKCQIYVLLFLMLVWHMSPRHINICFVATMKFKSSWAADFVIFFPLTSMIDVAHTLTAWTADKEDNYRHLHKPYYNSWGSFLLVPLFCTCVFTLPVIELINYYWSRVSSTLSIKSRNINYFVKYPVKLSRLKFMWGYEFRKAFFGRCGKYAWVIPEIRVIYAHFY